MQRTKVQIPSTNIEAVIATSTHITSAGEQRWVDPGSLLTGHSSCVQWETLDQKIKWREHILMTSSDIIWVPTGEHRVTESRWWKDVSLDGFISELISIKPSCLCKELWPPHLHQSHSHSDIKRHCLFRMTSSLQSLAYHLKEVSLFA